MNSPSLPLKFKHCSLLWDELTPTKIVHSFINDLQKIIAFFYLPDFVAFILVEYQKTNVQIRTKIINVLTKFVMILLNNFCFFQFPLTINFLWSIGTSISVSVTLFNVNVLWSVWYFLCFDFPSNLLFLHFFSIYLFYFDRKKIT